MATSNNAGVQALINAASAVSPTDPNLLEKLEEIAKAMAAKQRELKAEAGIVVNEEALIDPADAFACEGCQ